METSTATINVLNITSVHAGRLLALADVELLIDGVAIVLHGVQVRADGSKTEITLPNYRAPDGSWRTAVTLPEEVRGPMGDAVMAAGLEAGLLMEKAAVV
jgi:stage V sporulation protein G